MQYYDIEIPNWDKYQVRKDLKSMNFFRVQTNVFSDPKLAECTLVGKLLWFYCLSVAAREQTARPRISYRLALRYLQVRGNCIHVAFKQLEQNQLVKILSRNESVPRVEKSIVKESKGEYTRAIEPVKPKKPKPKSWLTADFTAQIVAAWNATCAPDCPAIKGFNERRKAALKREAKDWNIEQFQELFNIVASSDFLSGRVKEWRCDFDWVFKGNNVTKILEGSYQNHEAQDKNSHASVMARVFEGLDD